MQDRICWPLVTQPMLQPTPNQTELRLMVSKSFFNVDSKNGSEKFLHRHSCKNVFFSKPTLGDQRKKSEKKKIFSGGTGEELFAYIFGIYIKNGFRNHQFQLRLIRCRLQHRLSDQCVSDLQIQFQTSTIIGFCFHLIIQFLPVDLVLLQKLKLPIIKKKSIPEHIQYLYIHFIHPSERYESFSHDNSAQETIPKLLQQKNWVGGVQKMAISFAPSVLYLS